MVADVCPSPRHKHNARLATGCCDAVMVMHRKDTSHAAVPHIFIVYLEVLKLCEQSIDMLDACDR